MWGNYDLSNDIKFKTHELGRPDLWSVKIGLDEIVDENDACLDFE